jgi:glycosyltransferase involved in cell wall biosynthesis
VTTLTRLLARTLLFSLYLGTLTIVTLCRWLLPRRPLPRENLRVLITGTFYNRGWLRAHAKPIVGATRVGTLVVVTDTPLDPLPKTVYSCPPAWLSGLLTRAPARLLQVVAAAWRNDCDVLVGYHIMPNALICIAVAAVLGRRAVYQMTGGPAQVVGGGAESENVLLRRIGSGSAVLEGLLLRLLDRFDAIVVRGGRAEAFLAARGVASRVRIIPAGIDVASFGPRQEERTQDVIFVGRLQPAKGCDLLQDVLIRLIERRPATRAVVLGDGPLRAQLASAFRAAGVAGQIEMPGQRDDVPEWLARSRVFLLTSPSEGLAIALLEAMCAGVVPVVSDVGELGDVVRSGENGFLVPSRVADDYVAAVMEALAPGERWARLSCRASETARAYAGTEAVSPRWDALLAGLPASTDPESRA